MPEFKQSVVESSHTNPKWDYQLVLLRKGDDEMFAVRDYRINEPHIKGQMSQFPNCEQIDDLKTQNHGIIRQFSNQHHPDKTGKTLVTADGGVQKGEKITLKNLNRAERIALATGILAIKGLTPEGTTTEEVQEAVLALANDL